MEPLPFSCEKQPAFGTCGMVVANHPLGTAAGYEMLAAGGGAADAAVAALFALCVVEPMMVGVAGGGMAHIRLANGTHTVIDGLAHAAASTHPDIYEIETICQPGRVETKGRQSEIGATAVAVPGNLAAWCAIHQRWGKLPLADVMDPAIRLAERGFVVTPYLEGAISEAAADLAKDAATSKLFLPDGQPFPAGSRMLQGDFGQSLRMIAKQGAASLHGGALGSAIAERIANDNSAAGYLSLQDLVDYRIREREVIRGNYRGWEIVGPPPPASSGVHIVQMLNIIETHDVASLEFGTENGLRLLAETMRVGFEDRRTASGDPDFVNVPVEKLTSKKYAAECQHRLNSPAQMKPPTDQEGANTTHVTIADGDGNVVCATHTINGTFGARIMVPDTGIIPNNYMMNFDPNPGRALSIEPGKRVPTSMAPMMILRNSAMRWALGLPGGLRIFPSAFQAIVNLIDHRMTLQQAVEAPRIWTDGYGIEVEDALSHRADNLTVCRQKTKVVPHVGGGMNAIEFAEDGMMQGAACWRSDGTVAALGGGRARPGVRFWPGRTLEYDKANLSKTDAGARE